MIVLPSENLRVELDGLYQQGYIYQRPWRWSEAVNTYRKMYETLIENQPQGSRFHKGAPLHLSGIALLHVQKTPAAVKSFLLAYAEDALSKSRGEEGRADWEPAGLVLKFQFDICPDLLEVIKQLACGAKETKQVVQDPTAILATALAEMGVNEQEIEKLCGRIPEIKPERSLDKLKSPLERRVFVGGNHRLIAILEEIKKTVAQAGYDAILADDFEMPEDRIHDDTLMLLQSCRLAVFDISLDNGHLMEIPKIPEYGIHPLFVYSAMDPSKEPHVSRMLKSWLERFRFEPQPYRTIDKLCELVREYLGVKDFHVIRSYTEATTEISELLPTRPYWVEEAGNESETQR